MQAYQVSIAFALAFFAACGSLNQSPSLASVQQLALTQVGGIQCQGSMDSQYHIHDILLVYKNGVQLKPAPTLGHGQKCLYWMHMHDDETYPYQIVHIEAPHSALLKPFSLGQLLDIWAVTAPASYPIKTNETWMASLDGQAATADLWSVYLNPDLEKDSGHHIVVLSLNTQLDQIAAPPIPEKSDKGWVINGDVY